MANFVIVLIVGQRPLEGAFRAVEVVAVVTQDCGIIAGCCDIGGLDR